MKNYFLFYFILISTVCSAQISPEDFQKIKSYEDTIRIYGDTLINSETKENRTIASYRIIKTLTKALKIKNSFYYRWDSLLPMKILEPEDHSFKIFTWYTRSDEDLYKYYGTIQLKSDTLKMFPLIDYSDFTDNQEQVVVDNNNWIGCMYYGIKTVKSGKNTFYTLFGWDGNNATSNKKILEALWFKNGKPRFGATIFDFGKGKLQNRVIIEFANEASATLNFDAAENKIVYDHVAANGDALEGVYANYIPDGTYEGFVWKKGKWLHLNDITYQKRKDGEAPNVQKKESLQLYTPLPAPKPK